MEFCAFKTFDQVPKFASYFLAVDQIFRSTEKHLKFWSTDYETFDQLKNDNFDQLIFGQTTPCHLNAQKIIGLISRILQLWVI
jgi:hypothetical protein